MRSVQWKKNLKIIGKDPLNELSLHRSNYETLYTKYTKTCDDLIINNPLSTHQEWIKPQKDKSLKETIRLDTKRLYPDSLIKKDIEIIENVLFVWSKMNPVISYRQGICI